MNRRNVERKGGIYLETTEYHYWFLSDKTRKIEKANLDEVKKRTNIGLLVEYLDSKAKVHVNNPNSISRVLLCKNDDVGTMVSSAVMKYGTKGIESIDDLVASYGEHITVEPFGINRIRVCVYPLYPSLVEDY